MTHDLYIVIGPSAEVKATNDEDAAQKWAAALSSCYGGAEFPIMRVMAVEIPKRIT